jgi:hypothetical protein
MMMMMMTTLVSEHYVRKYLRDSYVLSSIHLFEITLLWMKFIKCYTLHAYCNVSKHFIFTSWRYVFDDPARSKA